MSQDAFPVEIGEGFAGSGGNAAHINTVLGLRDGVVGTAFATALAQPTPGHVPFLAVWAPNIPLSPPTLFVNKATITDDRHGSLTWGAAQAGVAAGVTEYVAERFTPRDTKRLALIVAVWVNPEAHDADDVYVNNRTASLTALASGQSDSTGISSGDKAVDAFLSGLRPFNPYFTPRS
jgi:5,6,7,8-tetrahydromethanopterin hydro-lyase